MTPLELLIPRPDERVPFAASRADADADALRARGHAVHVATEVVPTAERLDAVLTYGWRDAARVRSSLRSKHLHVGAGPGVDCAAGATEDELIAAYARPVFKVVESHAAQRDVLLQHGGRCWVVPPCAGHAAGVQPDDEPRTTSVAVLLSAPDIPEWVDELRRVLGARGHDLSPLHAGDRGLRRALARTRVALVAARTSTDGLAPLALEAAAAGCRVLLADSPPLHELVPPDAPSCFLPMDDPEAAARHVCTCLDDASRDRELEGVTARMVRSHDQSRRVDALESVLAEIAGHEQALPRARHASVWLPLATSDVATERRLVRYAFAAPFAEGRRVLDLGCGEGEGAVRLAEAGAESVLAVDPSAIAIARARRLRARRGLRFETMRPDAIRLGTGAVELVVALGELTDESTRRDAIDEAARVLAPHGTLLIALSNAARDIAGETPGIGNGDRGIESLRRHLEYAFGNVSLFAERIEPGGVSFRGRTLDPLRDAGWIAMATRPRRLPIDTERTEEARQPDRRNAA